MKDYEAPTIVGRSSLRASLSGVSRSQDSDAEIKHNAQIIGHYEAPAISEEHDLEGGMAAIFKSIDK
jgi:hypothetical protein